MDGIEWLLAKWTGRETWPSVKARVESRLAIPGLEIRRTRQSRFTLLSYEVDSQTYVAAIREITGQDDMPQHVGSHVEIQYNPKHPARHYFAPERKLAGRLVIFLSLIAAGIAIAFAIKGAS